MLNAICQIFKEISCHTIYPKPTEALRVNNTNHLQYLLGCSTYPLVFGCWELSHAEKERTACKAEQIHKMTTIFTQNGPRLSF